jgi:signal transduction histidine kinase
MFRQVSPARWLTLCAVCLALAFVVNIVYSRRIAARIDAHVRSITDDSAASVVYLARVTEDIRLISARAMLLRKETVHQDRGAIASWLEELDGALRAYHLTEDYPGEREVSARAERQRPPFVAAVEHALASVEGGRELRDAALAELDTAADALAATIGELMRLNADEVAREGAAIEAIGQRARDIFFALRGLMLVLTVAGIFLGWAASRQHVELVELSRGAAEARARELEMFAARVAHDLRAPLAVIEMRATAAQRSDKLDGLKETIDRIGRQGRRMAQIIDALLEFAQAGARPVPGHCAEIAEVVEDVTSDCRSIAGETGVEFVVEPIPTATTACSHGVLGIILSNLVHNAAKYVGAGALGPGRVVIRVHPRERMVRFEVEDTGPGLPPGSEAMVFEPFVRASSSRKGGIGLGLATVKRLVEAHGGQVGVVSSPGSGCRFWFELPAAADSAVPAPLSTVDGRRATSVEGRIAAG